MNKRKGSFQGFHRRDTKTSDDTEIELAVLQKKNSDLVKALVSERQVVQRLQTENYRLQEVYMTAVMEKRAMQQHFSTFFSKAVGSIVGFSDEMTELLVTAQANADIGTDLVLNETQPECRQPDAFGTPRSANLNRMKAVRPMINGHVINRPIINLRRVPIEQFIQSGSNGYRAEVANPETEEATYTEQENVSVENEDSSVPQSLSARRLDTLPEESSAVDRTNVSSFVTSPLVTGLFSEVRVYLSPLKNLPCRGTKPQQTSTPNIETSNVTRRKGTVSLAPPETPIFLGPSCSGSYASEVLNSDTTPFPSLPNSLNTAHETSNLPSTSRVSTPYKTTRSRGSFDTETNSGTPRTSLKRYSGGGESLPVCTVSLTRYRPRRPIKPLESSSDSSPERTKAEIQKEETGLVKNKKTKKSVPVAQKTAPLSSSRPKRSVKVTSFKEMPLNRKMRRS